MLKKIIFAGLMIATLAVAAAVYLYNKPVEGIESMKTDMRISSMSLLEDYEADEQKANSNYLDKVLEVTGSVSKVETKDDITSVYLETANPISNVIIQLEETDTIVAEGDDVIVKGVCTGYLMDVVLIRGKVIDDKK